MHLRWSWLLRFFGERLQKQFKFKIIEINKKKMLGETKGITPNQKFLGIILWGFYVFKMVVAIAFLCENAVEAD